MLMLMESRLSTLAMSKTMSPAVSLAAMTATPPFWQRTLVWRPALLFILSGALTFYGLIQQQSSISTIDRSQTSFVLPTTTVLKPRIVWLMSYPNSGTSFTMTFVERASDRNTATNYGIEITDIGTHSTPVHPQHPEGPYWEGIGIRSIGTPRELPDSYVLTKTHCGGRCVNCGADEYVVNLQQYLDACARTTARHDKERAEGLMNPQRVARLVHLFRNPFHNIVARYHLERRHKVQKDATYNAKWPNNATGFATWCHMLDTKYKDSERKILDKSTLKLMSRVPCHGEFYKYVQWHERAREIVPLLENLPVLTIYYEDYQHNYNATLSRLLDFMDLELRGALRPFRDLPDYADHYTTKQRQAAKALAKHLASPKLWKQIRHYFD